MVYSSESAKWKAYQFSDPFAAGLFYVCNKVNKYFCRPDCDARPITNLKSEIKFVNHSNDAINLGYIPCEYCDPLSLPLIDVNLLVNCVASINKKIGFLPPLLDENEERNNQKIKENLIESKKSNEEQMFKAINSSGAGRRSSVPVISYDGKFSKDFENTSLSKNDSDHYRLVDLACRHLALAAAMNIFQPQSPKGPRSPEDSNSPPAFPNSKKRRRRGGVLGFKELAAKSKLSAWHFHRVFKSVTGLTPKTYGDKCWEYIKNFKESGEFTTFHLQDYQTPVSNSTNDLSTPTSPEVIPPSNKRIKLETDFSPSSKVSNEIKDGIILPNQPLPLNNSNSLTEMSSLNVMSPPIIANNEDTKIKYSVPQQPTFELNQPIFNSNFNMFNDQQSEIQVNPSNHTRAFSAPDLTKYNRLHEPPTLFGHTQRLEENQSQNSQLQGSPLVNNILDEVTNTVSVATTATSANSTNSINENELFNDLTDPINDFSNFIDSNNEDFNFSFQNQFNSQNNQLLTNDLIDSNSLSLGLSPELLSTTNIGL